MLMEKELEIITCEEREKIIDEYTEGYMADGFDESEARTMAIADFNYEIIISQKY